MIKNLGGTDWEVPASAVARIILERPAEREVPPAVRHRQLCRVAYAAEIAAAEGSFRAAIELIVAGAMIGTNRPRGAELAAAVIAKA